MGKKGKQKNRPLTSGESEMEYMAEDDLRTLKRAEEIKADSKRMAMVKQKAQSEIKAMSHIVALKNYIKKAKDHGKT